MADLLLAPTGDFLLTENGEFIALEAGNPIVSASSQLDLARTLNRLAGTAGLAEAGAANAWAGTNRLELVGALNAKNSTTGLGFNRVCKSLATANGGDGSKDAQGALASIP